MERHELLARAHVSVISAEDDAELDATARTITGSVRVSGRVELAQLLDELVTAQHGRVVVPKTLDLYGHSTARTAQLRLGDWVIDAASPSEQTFLRELADRAVLPRLGITSVRLLACRTADTDAGRATMCRLAELLGVEIYGTRHLLYDAHHDAQGFLAAWQFLLVSASELRGQAPGRARVPAAQLELGDAPRRMATPAAADRLLALVRREAGAPMTGPGAAPSYVVFLPTDAPRSVAMLPTDAPRSVVMLPTGAAPRVAADPRPGERDVAMPTGGEPSHEVRRATAAAAVAHVLFDGAFVRLYPDGPGAPGVVYPVADPAALRALIAILPPAD